MRCFTCFLFMVALFGVAIAENLPQPLQAEGYLYGKSIGTITMDDVDVVDGVITIKQLPYWPKWVSEKQALPVTEATRVKQELIDQVVSRQIMLEQHAMQVLVGRFT